MRVGGGSLTYEVAEGWGQLPEGWQLGQTAAVATDSQDRVYVFHRPPRDEPPVLVFDRDGRLVASWGKEFLDDAHGMFIGPDPAAGGAERLWLVDRRPHVVQKCTLDGQGLQTLGIRGAAGEQTPFNRPTDVAVAPNGDVYVSDGYGNARVHRYAADGRLIQSWGTPGSERAQFKLVHSVWVDRHGSAREAAGRILVADRENHRIQRFTPDGEYLGEWGDFRQPTDIFVDRDGFVYVPELQHRISILDPDGALVARWGGEPRREPGGFVAPHGAWADSRGDLYVCEVLQGQRVQKFIRV
jgi:sugar lactone lactonase YvrE